MSALFGIRRGEGRRVLLGAALFFLFIGGIVAVKASANALFLSRHDPRLLPQLYIGASVLVAVLMAWFGPVLADPSRRGRRFAVPLTAGVVLAALVGGLALGLPASPAIYLVAEATSTLLNVQFWGIAAAVFDPRAGRRLFGLLAGVGQAGSVLAGLAIGLGAQHIGAEILVLIGAGCFVGCGALAALLGRGVHDASRRGAPKPKPKAAVGEAMRAPLARRLMLFVGAMAVVSSLVDYAFRIEAQAQFSEAELAAYFGELNFHVGLVAAIFQVALASRLLDRLGLFRYLLVVPLMLLVGGGRFLAEGSLTLLYLVKVIENAGSMSIYHPALQILLGAVAEERRPALRSLVDGAAKKAGNGVGGVLLVLLALLPLPAAGMGLSTTSLTIAGMLVLTVVQIVTVLRLRRPYAGALLERLRRPRAEAPIIATRLDPATRQALQDTVQPGSAPQAVRTALELLERDGRSDMAPLLAEALRHPEPQVRIDALALPEAPELQVRTLAKEDPDPEVRAAATRHLSRTLRNPRMALEGLLDDADIRVRTAAVEGLLRPGGETHALAFNRLIEVVEHRETFPPEQRLHAARLLGRLRGLDVAEHLEHFLQDPDAEVRRTAARSAGRLKDTLLVPALFALLSDRESRREAREALAAYGDAVVPQAEEWLNDYDRPLQVRLWLPRLLRYIGTEAAARALLFSNIHDDALLRHRCIVAMSRLRKRQPGVRFDSRRCVEAAQRRIRAFEHYGKQLAALRDGPDALRLLRKTIEHRRAQNVEGCFRLIGLIRDQGAVATAVERARSAQDSEQSAALELLEALLPETLRSAALKLLDETEPAAKGADWTPVLDELLESRDVLLRAVAIHAARALDHGGELSYPPLVQVTQSSERQTMTPELLDRIFHLERAEIFAGLGVDDLVSVAAIAKPRGVRTGETIFEEGSPADALYIITLGEVRVTKENAELAQLRAGDSFGGTSLLDGQPHAATATASSDGSLLVIDRIELLDLLTDRPELMQGLFSVMTTRLREMLELAAKRG